MRQTKFHTTLMMTLTFRYGESLTFLKNSNFSGIRTYFLISCVVCVVCVALLVLFVLFVMFVLFVFKYTEFPSNWMPLLL